MKNNPAIICLAALLFAAPGRAQVFNDGLEVYIESGLPVNLGGDFVNNAGTLLQSGTLTLRNFTNQQNALLDGGGDFIVKGNWLNYGDLLFEGSLRFEGNGTGFLKSNDAGINRIALAKTGPGPGVQLLDGLRIVEELKFAAANNKLTISDFDLEIEPTATILSANYSRFIVTNGTGMLTRRLMPTGSYFAFPIGATASTFNPVDIRNTGSPDDIAVRCLPLVLSGGGSGSAIEHDAVAASWQIDETSPGGSHLTIYPGWSGADEYGTFTRSLCTVGRFNGSAWTVSAQGYGTATGGNPYKRGRGNVLQLGYFAVFDAAFNGNPPETEDRAIVAAVPKLKIKASPNPFAGHFRLEKTAAPPLDGRVTLQTAGGQTLRSLVWPADWPSLDLDGSLLAAGVYFVSVDFGGGRRAVLPVVKQ